MSARPVTSPAATGLAPARWYPGQIFEVQGHRGAAGLRAENTLAAVACALEVGVSSIECDVALTADDVVVLSHDGYLLDAAGRVAVKGLALADLHRADVAPPGSRLATLGSVLALLEVYQATSVRLDIEIKSARHSDPGWDAAHVVAAVLAVVRAHGALGLCSLRSFDVDVVRQTRRQSPRLPRVLLAGTVADDVEPDLAVDPGRPPQLLVDLAVELGVAALAPGTDLLSAELVDRCHEAGLPVLPWTANDAASLQRLLDLGVDGVCTDRPDLARALLTDRGIAVPQPLDAPVWVGSRSRPVDDPLATRAV